MNEDDLVYADQYGLLGSNFYWYKYEAKGITKEEILSVGLVNDRVQVHKEIIDVLVDVDRVFQERGYRMYIKEGYRSKKLYELVYKKRVEKFGKEETDKLLNMKDMPHSNGKTVDIALWNQEEDKEVYQRGGDDGDSAYFINFYRNKDDEQSKHFQELQDFVINTMQDRGFRLGTKQEYFHFDYRPEESKNY